MAKGKLNTHGCGFLVLAARKDSLCSKSIIIFLWVIETVNNEMYRNCSYRLTSWCTNSK